MKVSLLFNSDKLEAYVKEQEQLQQLMGIDKGLHIPLENDIGGPGEIYDGSTLIVFKRVMANGEREKVIVDDKKLNKHYNKVYIPCCINPFSLKFSGNITVDELYIQPNNYGWKWANPAAFEMQGLMIKCSKIYCSANQLGNFVNPYINNEVELHLSSPDGYFSLDGKLLDFNRVICDKNIKWPLPDKYKIMEPKYARQLFPTEAHLIISWSFVNCYMQDYEGNYLSTYSIRNMPREIFLKAVEVCIKSLGRYPGNLKEFVISGKRII